MSRKRKKQDLTSRLEFSEIIKKQKRAVGWRGMLFFHNAHCENIMPLQTFHRQFIQMSKGFIQ